MSANSPKQVLGPDRGVLTCSVLQPVTFSPEHRAMGAFSLLNTRNWTKPAVNSPDEGKREVRGIDAIDKWRQERGAHTPLKWKGVGLMKQSCKPDSMLPMHVFPMDSLHVGLAHL